MGRGGTLPACRQQAAGGFPRIGVQEPFPSYPRKSAESAFLRVLFCEKTPREGPRMPTDPRKRQKKQERRTAKRKARQHEVSKEKHAGLPERLTAAASA